jgi:hypothetical protein
MASYARLKERNNFILEMMLQQYSILSALVIECLKISISILMLFYNFPLKNDIPSINAVLYTHLKVTDTLTYCAEMKQTDNV